MDIKANGARNSSAIHIDKKIITEVLSKYKDLDIAITDPEWNEEKQNYKKVRNWKSKPKLNGAAAADGKQLIIRNTDEYPELDWDIFKHLEPWQAQYIKDKFPKTFEFGRDGRGHSLYKVKNLPEVIESIERLKLGERTILEYRGLGCYSIFAGALDKNAGATVSNKEITEIDYKYLKKLFNRAAALTSLTLITPGKKEVINDFLLAAAGEFYVNKILKTTTIKIFKSWLYLIKRTDREAETIKTIEGIYKSGKAGNIFSKNYLVPISDAEKYQFREIVKRVGFNYEPGDAPATDAPAIPLKVYRLLDPNYKPHKREFVMEGYLKKGCMTVIAGEPGVSKTQFLAQLAYSFVSAYEFFGKKVNETGNALICTAEEDRDEMELRIRALDKNRSINTGHHIDVIAVDTNLKLVKFKKDSDEKTKQFSQLEDLIKENNYKFIGLDPLISLQAGAFDENNNPQMDSFCKNYLIPLAQKHGACVAVNHHTNKISMITEGGIIDNNALHAARGASSLAGAARIIIALSPMSRQLWEKQFKKSNLVKEDEIKLYVAIVDAKNNYSPLGARPKWLRKHVEYVDCVNGQEPVATLIASNLSDLQDKRSAMSMEHARKEIAKYLPVIDEYMKPSSGSSTTFEAPLHKIATKLANLDPAMANCKEPKDEKNLIFNYRTTLQTGFGQGGAHEIKHNGFYYWYDYDRYASKTHHMIYKEDIKSHDKPLSL